MTDLFLLFSASCAACCCCCNCCIRYVFCCAIPSVGAAVPSVAAAIPLSADAVATVADCRASPDILPPLRNSFILLESATIAMIFFTTRYGVATIPQASPNTAVRIFLSNPLRFCFTTTTATPLSCAFLVNLSILRELYPSAKGNPQNKRPNITFMPISICIVKNTMPKAYDATDNTVLTISFLRSDSNSLSSSISPLLPLRFDILALGQVFKDIISPKTYNVNDMEQKDILVVPRIRYLMEAHGLTQYALAKRLGISQSTICNWLNGKKEPSIESLWKVADFFDVTVDYLIGRSEF